MQTPTEKPLVVVFGATGHQGCAVSKYLAESKEFRLRLVAREHESQKIRDCANKVGAEVAIADLNISESLKDVFQGADYCYLVTDFWDASCLSPEKEYAQAKNAIDHAKTAKIKHMIFSMAEDTTEITGGKVTVEHWKGKGKAVEYLVQSQIPYTLIKLPFYYENFLSDFKPQKRENGKIVLDLPLGNARLPMMSVCDLGPVVGTILKNPGNYKSKTYHLAAEVLTIKQLCDIFSQVLGQPVEIPEMELEAWVKSTPIKAAKKMVSEWRYLREFPDTAQRADISETKSFVTNPKSLVSWLGEHKANLI